MNTSVDVGKVFYSANGALVVSAARLNENSFNSLLTTFLSVAAAVDVLIAISLTFLLVSKWTTTGFTSTAHHLQRLAVFSVNTGIWTATFALLTVILMQLFPSNLLYAVFGIPLCSVYCNTLLANLNVREYVRSGVTVRNVGVDLFTSSSSRPEVSDDIKTEKQHGRANIISSDHQAYRMMIVTVEVSG
ncbi:hypothetical protein J3R83DRAFT_3233 [Lanmaoa asiatica]|nr:hypothetical protein J3R83DRAFT_3233 [Lanmaoa asiatica]